MWKPSHRCIGIRLAPEQSRSNFIPGIPDRDLAGLVARLCEGCITSNTLVALALWYNSTRVLTFGSRDVAHVHIALHVLGIGNNVATDASPMSVTVLLPNPAHDTALFPAHSPTGTTRPSHADLVTIAEQCLGTASMEMLRNARPHLSISRQTTSDFHETQGLRT